MEEASRQAKEAVAAAMAKLNSQGTQPKPTPATTSVDNLTRKVGEMRTSDGHVRGGWGGMRGPRGNFRGGFDQHTRKMEIPKSDYDFESANAKFNKGEMIKEAIATGSPLTETPESTTNGVDSTAAPTTTNGEKRKDSLNKVPSSTEAYNKASSFFDNISSESKDREEERNQPRGKVFRNEEIKKNFETFGQGTVDGGGFRGRGRGGYRGRGRGYGGQQRVFANGRGGGYGVAVRGRGNTSNGVAQS
jgi:protein LSM14